MHADIPLIIFLGFAFKYKTESQVAFFALHNLSNVCIFDNTVLFLSVMHLIVLFLGSWLGFPPYF